MLHIGEGRCLPLNKRQTLRLSGLTLTIPVDCIIPHPGVRFATVKMYLVLSIRLLSEEKSRHIPLAAAMAEDGR